MAHQLKDILSQMGTPRATVGTYESASGGFGSGTEGGSTGMLNTLGGSYNVGGEDTSNGKGVVQV